VARKWEAYGRTLDPDAPDPATRDLEEVAIQMLVNERRAERGLPAYPYDFHPSTHPESDSVFERAIASAAANGPAAARQGRAETHGLDEVRVTEAQIRSAMKAVPPAALPGGQTDDCGCER
jgi:hypothetical protein